MVDRYTKAVLTVIAVALVWIAVSLTTVPAAEATSPRAIAAQDVNIASVGGIPIRPSYPLGQYFRALPVEQRR